MSSGREIWLRQGKLFDVVRASIATPGLFTPVIHDGTVLVDGGLVNPVPVSMCRAFGAEIVIAVDLSWGKLGPYRNMGRELPAPPEEPSCRVAARSTLVCAGGSSYVFPRTVTKPRPPVEITVTVA